MKHPQTAGPDPRRRDPGVHRAILDATVRLLEAHGYKALTIEAIAAEAEVGKQTIYRWWSSKAALVMEAYIDVSATRAPEPDTGEVGADLEAILLPVFKLNRHPERGTALANKSLMAEAQMDRDFLKTYAALHRAWRGPLRNIFERAKTRGQLAPETDSDALIDMLLGAAWYRMLLEHAPLTPAFARTLIKTVVDGNR